jgi:antitoxin component YwqK of YwqJK toxin-antitoxin module
VEDFQSLRFSRYDEAGNKVEEAHSIFYDSLSFKITYAYDSAGKLIEQVHFDANESPSLKIVYEYDHAGRLMEQKTFGADDPLQTVRRPVYTTEGLRIEEETLPLSEEYSDTSYLIDIEGTDFSVSAGVGDSIRKVYDGNEKLIEVTTRNNKGKRTGKMLFAYDDNGRLIEVLNYSSDGFHPAGERTKLRRLLEPLALRSIKIFFLLKGIYSFGLKGELKKAARSFVYGPLIMSNVFIYDNKGRVIEEQTDFIGSIVMKKVFAYDEKGNKAEEIEYTGDDNLLQKQNYSREYDSRGNWVKETVAHQFLMGEKLEHSTVITYRNISYYSN